MSRCYELCHDVDCFSDTPHRCHDDECPRNTKSAPGNQVKMIQLQAQVDMLKQLLYEARNPMLPTGEAVSLDTYVRIKQGELLNNDEYWALKQTLEFLEDQLYKSHQGYFSSCGWAGGMLNNLLKKARKLHEPSHNSADPS